MTLMTRVALTVTVAVGALLFWVVGAAVAAQSLTDVCTADPPAAATGARAEVALWPPSLDCSFRVTGGGQVSLARDGAVWRRVGMVGALAAVEVLGIVAFWRVTGAVARRAAMPLTEPRP